MRKIVKRALHISISAKCLKSMSKGLDLKEVKERFESQSAVALMWKKGWLIWWLQYIVFNFKIGMSSLFEGHILMVNVVRGVKFEEFPNSYFDLFIMLC